MIYVSSASVKAQRIGDAVSELAAAGFRCIELSGGTGYYDAWLDDLLRLKQQFGLHYRLHNYFPPPPEPFILNLASDDGLIFEKSLQFYQKALDISRQLGCRRYGLHAGFLYDPPVSEIGARLSTAALLPYEKAAENFFRGLRLLQKRAGETAVYVENHVLARKNLESFSGNNPLMLTCAAEYFSLAQICSFPLLLDLAHLYVSCCTLGLDYEKEASLLLAKTDYLHLSGNSGLEDTNGPLTEHGPILAPLAGISSREYTVTLEVYGTVDEIKSSVRALQSFLRWE